MLLNLTWLVPGLPIIASLLITVLLISFSRTMNRLTKPVSYFLILSLITSEIISFVLFENNVSGIVSLFDNLNIFSNAFQIYVDNQALKSSLALGSILLFTMIISFLTLKRRSGYVRYLIFLGLLSGLVNVFSFSGAFFHNFYDPISLSLERAGVFIL